MLKELLKQQKFLYSQIQLYKRKQRHKQDKPDWNQVIQKDSGKWQAALNQAKTGANILVATSVGGDIHMISIESLLAVALTLRETQVHILLCDGVLPACFWCDSQIYPNYKYFARTGPQPDLCQNCFTFAQNLLQPLGLIVHCYSELLTPTDARETEKIAHSLPFSEIPAYTLDGVAVGEHALAGALRFYARSSLQGETYGESILRRYFQAALLTTKATQKLLQTVAFDCAVFNHGIYVPQGLIGEVARSLGVRVVNWNPAYRKQCFIFTHHDTYHHQLMCETVSNWENMPFTQEQEDELMGYLKSRWDGSQDWIWFHEHPEFDLQAIASETGVDFSQPCIGLLTNVLWDAQLHYPANAFENMLDWVLQTINYFAQRPDLQLLIRVHPAEIRGTLISRQPLVEEINKFIPQLPPNVFLIPPASGVSTYAAMLQCNAVLIYGTKMGVELTSMGIPVIVAGEAWIRHKNITMDASSVEEYFEYLAKLPLKQGLDEETTRRARKYAYHFFFRRMIPLEFTTEAKNASEYKLKEFGLDDLMPGKSKGLDVICNGILQGTEFIYE
ncbi:MAG: capsule biosynthesis protein [Gomphosphaeria aponina SAG 52.96 = DSM 107014]|uniref:Capsule biosynthesis protein n=1 Tax=Gomphosphaeria aponina SAG 52.96 = DSM 107014 TaxID=1521640 RepID=A0A941GRC0_9CHRO|nr:capsule biosynthesis protein [Gomphosphaeria aponina SAG 52.96 = DSM 107014]